MKYALNLAEDGRILSATYEEYACEGNVLVDELPDGDISEYLYVDGQYVHEPYIEPVVYPTADHNVIAGEYVTADGVLYKAIENIPNGGKIITGQNAVATTVEEQLYELTKGE